MMKAHYFGHSGRIQASRRFRTLGEILEMHRGYAKRTSAALMFSSLKRATARAASWATAA